MKKILLIALILMMIMSLASCGQQVRIEMYSGETVNLTAEAKLSATPLAPDRYCSAGEYESIRAMAMELFRETASRSEAENLLISPVSIMAALAMTAQGAEDETLAQFEAVFGKEPAFAASLLSSYTDTITMHNETAEVNLANSVWIRDDAERLAVKEEFLAKCNVMRAEVFRSAFNDGTVRDINDWVENNTDGMIDEILDEIPEAAVIYLVNALAFDNEWQHIYEKYQIREGEFTTVSGEKQKVDFMYSMEGTFLKDDKATGFIKPYKDDFSFVAILPDEGVSVDEYIAGMNADTLSNLIEGGKESYSVSAGLPKFINETSENLVPVLEAMGLTEMFDAENADFGAMAASTRGNIFISRVAHKAFIEVDSEGTRAAATTMVEASDGCAMVSEEVILNRPFIYIIVDDYSNERLPLFIGTVESFE